MTNRRVWILSDNSANIHDERSLGTLIMCFTPKTEFSIIPVEEFVTSFVPKIGHTLRIMATKLSTF